MALPVIKVTGSFEGETALKRRIRDTISPERQAAALTRAAKPVRIAAQRFVPRETGDLQRAITTWLVSATEIAIGVPAGDPNLIKAFATEYGTWNYSVGSRESPKTDWPAKSKPTAIMPWLRPAVLVSREKILRAVRRALFTGRRGFADAFDQLDE